MKVHIVGLLFVVLCLGAQATDEFHMFTDTQGRTIELKVIKCDFEHDKVLVERQDRRRLQVKISNFCAEDQEYLREWFMLNELLSERHLKISCDDKVIDKHKETVTAMQQSSSGHQLKEVEIGEKEYEKIAYEITFENKAAFSIEKAQVEYRIYYEQTAGGVDQDPEHKVFRGEGTLALLEPGSLGEFMTETVEIYNDNLSAQNIITLDEKGNQSVGALEPGEGEVHGIRGRLIIPLASGETLIRDFHHPSSLSEKKYPWDESLPSLTTQ